MELTTSSRSRLRKLLRSERIASRKTSNDTVAVVTTRGGRKSNYDREEIEEMLDSRGQVVSMYQGSDNLPRWLEQAGWNKTLRESDWEGKATYVKNPYAKNFGGPWRPGKGWASVADILQKILSSSRPVKINVQSDDRSKNGISW